MAALAVREEKPSRRKLVRAHLTGTLAGVKKRMPAAWYFAQSVDGVPRRALVVSRWTWRKVEEFLFDAYYRQWGLDTKGPDFDRQFDGTSDFVGYVPTPWRVLRQLVGAGSLAHDDVLLEYGSGKGRVVVWVAARFPVQRIVGIDHNPESAAAALRNVKSWRGPLRCGDIQLTCGDATQFDVPDEVNIIYLYNPFVDQTFLLVLAKVSASLARRPRRLKIIYLFPFMHQALVAAGFSVLRTREDLFYPWTIYTIGGPNPARGPGSTVRDPAAVGRRRLAGVPGKSAGKGTPFEADGVRHVDDGGTGLGEESHGTQQPALEEVLAPSQAHGGREGPAYSSHSPTTAARATKKESAPGSRCGRLMGQRTP